MPKIKTDGIKAKQIIEFLSEPLCETCDDGCLLRATHVYCDDTNRITKIQLKGFINWLNSVNRSGGNYFGEGNGDKSQWLKTIEFPFPLDEWKKLEAIISEVQNAKDGQA